MSNRLLSLQIARYLSLIIILTVSECAVEVKGSILSFTLDTTNGSASTDTDVVLQDVSGGVKFSFDVNDLVNNADIAAVYLNFANPIPGDLVISGPGVITGSAFNTKNVQAGNIGQTFDLGLAIGAVGSGSDFFDSFMFTLSGTGLDVSDFFNQTFAVRGQSVGPGSNFANPGTQSSKEFGTAPPMSDPPMPDPSGGGDTPEPTSGLIWLLLAAVVSSKRKMFS